MIIIVPIFLLLLAVTVFGVVRFSNAVATYGDVEIQSGSGAAVAEKVLLNAGVEGVEVVERDILLSDYYDATRRKLVLSKESFANTTAAAVGIAIHELGHAIQQMEGGGRVLAKRLSSIRMAHLLGGLMFWIPIIMGIFRVMNFRIAILVILFSWAVLMFYGLLTIGVEFDASNRGLRALEKLRLLRTVKEREAVEAIVHASAWQRCGDVLRSPQLVLYYLLPFAGWKK